MSRHLVIGSGSIARRHVSNLRRLFGGEVGCVSASGRVLSESETEATHRFASLQEGIAWAPSFAVVASPAPFHVEQARALLAAGIPVLVEKPLSDSLARLEAARGELQRHRGRIDVAYNLRHLGSARRLGAALDDHLVGRLHAVMIDVGQYLPDWRPGSDYRQQVSARQALGGGVLLELSHEFDYLTWLFGRFDRALCVAGNSGLLDIDVEDRVDAMLWRQDGLVAHLHLDFLQRVPSRSCKVIGEHGNLAWDLRGNSLRHWRPDGGCDILFDDPGADRNSTYVAELERFAQVAAGELEPLVPLESGIHTLELVDALRRSARMGAIVDLPKKDA